MQCSKYSDLDKVTLWLVFDNFFLHLLDKVLMASVSTDQAKSRTLR